MAFSAVPPTPLESRFFDWNDTPGSKKPVALEINDETLRDGLQGAGAVNAPASDKCELLRLMAGIGIRAASLGLPAAGERALADVIELARCIRDERLALEANCAARTLVGDIVPIVEAVQRSGQPIVAHTFIGSSPLRIWSENWDVAFLQQHAYGAIDFAVKQGLEVAFVTEDTTRSPPSILEPLFRGAVDRGASRLVLCDTTGHATPQGTQALVQWTRSLVARMRAEVTVEWHGHNDRGRALVNALTAARSGATRIHTCALGMGERAGNTATELLLLNAALLGWGERDLSGIAAYVQKAISKFGAALPYDFPFLDESAELTRRNILAPRGSHPSLQTEGHPRPITLRSGEFLAPRVGPGRDRAAGSS